MEKVYMEYIFIKNFRLCNFIIYLPILKLSFSNIIKQTKGLYGSETNLEYFTYKIINFI